MLRRLLAVAPLVGILTACSQGIGDREAVMGRVYASTGDVSAAEQLLASAVAREKAEAMFLLGTAILNSGIADRRIEGEILVRDAAEAGYGPAALRAAHLTAKGSAVFPKDNEQRAHYIKVAAEARIPEAQLAYAKMAAWGQHGVFRSNMEAITQARRAARQGSVEAMRFLGDLHYHEVFKIRRFPIAERWYLRAIENGDPIAMNNLAWMWAEQDRYLNDAEALAVLASASRPSAETADTLGVILQKRGEPGKALKLLALAYRLDATKWKSLARAAGILCQQGQRLAASDTWSEAKNTADELNVSAEELKRWEPEMQACSATTV